MKRTSILVADALPIFRTAVRNLLVREGDFRVEEAESLAEVRAIVSAGTPDIALIDLDLPPEGGLATVAHLSRECDAKTILWSFAPGRRNVLDGILAGACGYLHKEISPHGLIRALRGVIANEAPLARDLAALMIETMHSLEQRTRALERAAALSIRERQVLSLVARGARNRQIAEELIISEFTVKRHMQNILLKLELPSRYAAAGFYRSAFGAEDADVPVLLAGAS
jgi:DNA-binding NarL/FixJ family response regulator